MIPSVCDWCGTDDPDMVYEDCVDCGCLFCTDHANPDDHDCDISDRED